MRNVGYRVRSIDLEGFQALILGLQHKSCVQRAVCLGFLLCVLVRFFGWFGVLVSLGSIVPEVLNFPVTLAAGAASGGGGGTLRSRWRLYGCH